MCPWHVVSGPRKEPTAAAGEWLDFKPNIYQIVEFFNFLLRLVEEYDPGENVVLDIRATNLSGRALLTTDFNINLSHDEVCRARTLEFKKKLPVEELRAEWERTCAGTMKRFVDLFPGPSVSIETMLSWIQNFMERKF